MYYRKNRRNWFPLGDMKVQKNVKNQIKYT